MMSGQSIIALVIVMAALCVILYRNNRRRDVEQTMNRLRKEFGQIPDKRMSAARYANVPAYYLRHRTDHSIDDITWNDLDLTTLYHRIDNTMSAAGEEYLYYLLRTPGQNDAESSAMIDHTAVQWFADDENTPMRVHVQRTLMRLGHTGRYSLYDYLDRLEELGDRSNLRNTLCCALPFLAVLLMLVHVQAGVVCLIAVFCYNLVTYYREKAEIDPYIISFRYLLRLMDAADRLCNADCAAIAADCKALRLENQTFAGFRRGSSLIMGSTETGSANPVDLILDYIRILLHLDLIKFNSMLHIIRAHRSSIDKMLRIVGRIDTEIAISSYRRSLPVSCNPEFVSAAVPPGDAAQGICLYAQGLVHPLLEHPVANSIDVTQCVLLTGSNASGKSTFLKAVAIAALLAQTVGFVPAAEYRAPRWRIYSSMALRDSMQDGDSYYMVEIKSLKRIVDAASIVDANPILCCIDEVLRGTNTIERIAASSEILEHLSNTRHVLCVAATHDVELADLLAPYRKYHFEETLRGEDVVFSYVIQEGRARSRNAIRLLAQIGFDIDITARAQERAAHFEETGIWK